ncbi:hypothetical protein Dsin_008134 [Dipteronia sinensis]|uniref:Reverse transcriptase zinc-binding domain-containing protein n=1 Tax=Dipteronia sinensis TaxID=43782 RepID=A0AAE0B1U9_9ROSI|nr:hypothetical protein Dsin_008134 [Dipteronia sinensis]
MVSNIRFSWDLLRLLRNTDTLPWVCGGDFNELLSRNEKKRGSDRSFVGLSQFREAVDECDLVDLGFSGPRFTWNNRRDGKDSIQKRLDRPILLICSTVTWYKRNIERCFRFEQFWLKENDIGNVIETAWSVRGHSLSTEDLKGKLDQCASNMLEWSKLYFGNLQKQIGEKNREIEHLYKKSGYPGIMNSIRVLEKEVEGLLDCNEIYWKQRSRADWLQTGDRNSKFFHLKASARKKKNTITSLLDTNGRPQKATDSVKSQLNEDQREALNSVFSAEEVREAIFSLSLTKAPCLNGFQAIFFQKFWGTVGGEVTRVCLSILNGEKSAERFNKTNVVMIPKVNNPTKIRDFRPISLCNVIYKEKTGRYGQMALKLDMSNAYHRVEWPFLEAAMVKMKFPPKLIKLIIDCISSSKLFFLLNDDNILFSKASSASGYRIRKILGIFKKASGQQINFQKTKVTFSPSVAASTMRDIQLIFGIADSNSQDMYLGFLSMVGMNKRILFKDIKDRVWKKMRGWKDNYFSFGGKEILIKAVVQAIPTFSMTKVLKAKYFKECDFLKAPAKSSCSHIWRSLVWGRELLSKGLRWTVGDGESISVFNDQWIPRPSTFKPITCDPCPDVRVAALIDRPMRGWRLDKLTQLLIPVDMAVIPGIPVSWRGGQDSLRWHYDKKGEYTVKSWYMLGLSEKHSNSASNPSSMHRWWNSLWKLCLPPKVRVFVWRACLDVLFSVENLWKRKIVDLPRCPRCKAKSESSTRALFDCKAARKIWKGTSFGALLVKVRNFPVLDVFQRVATQVGLEDFELFCMVTWAIWEDRNAQLNCVKGSDPGMVVTWVKDRLEEFQISRKAFSYVVVPPVFRTLTDWISPPPGQLKINMGVSLRSNSNSIGIGVTIRDDRGKVLVARSNCLFGSFNAEVSPFMALREGLMLARFYNFHIQVAKVSSAKMVSELY